MDGGARVTEPVSLINKFDIYSKEIKQCLQIYTIDNVDIRVRKTHLLGVRSRIAVRLVQKTVQYSTKLLNDMCLVPMNGDLQITRSLVSRNRS